MKIERKSIHNPCFDCHIRGHSYSPDDRMCESCEYNIAVLVLKEILKQNKQYSLCGFSILNEENNIIGCKIDLGKCENCKSFILDWDAILEKYNLKS